MLRVSLLDNFVRHLCLARTNTAAPTRARRGARVPLQSRRGRENIPIAGTNRRRGERICYRERRWNESERAPVLVEGLRLATRSLHLSGTTVSKLDRTHARSGVRRTYQPRRNVPLRVATASV
eukprot:1226279-Pyramimonas_sp.AAC.1